MYYFAYSFVLRNGHFYMVSCILKQRAKVWRIGEGGGGTNLP